MSSGSTVFKTMCPEEEAIVRFLLKMFNFDENNATDVILAWQLYRQVEGR